MVIIVLLVSKSSLICSHVFFKTRQLKKTKFKITSNIIYTNHFMMIYQILFYLEKLVKTFWLFGDTGASTKMDECFWFDDFFFLKQKEFFQQLWQSAWFRNARQVPFIHQLVIANTFQALVREELVKWPVFRGQKFSAVYTFFIRTYMRAPFFPLDQKYRSKAKSSLHSFSVKPTYLSQMLPSLLPSRRLRINWS